MAKSSIVVDTRRKTKEGLYPIKIRVTDKGKRKYYSTGYYIEDNEELKKLIDPNSKPRGNNKTKKEALISMKNKADEITGMLTVFNITQFEELFLRKSMSDEKKVIRSIEDYVKQLKEEERYSSADSHTSSKKSFSKYLVHKGSNPDDLEFGDITVAWLRDYEKWVLTNKNAISTVGLYIRNLKVVYNLSIDNNITPKEWNPFGRRKYVIPSTVNNKRPLTFDQINKLFHFSCDDHKLIKHRDYFMFMYFAQGMNLKDMASLKWSNLSGNTLLFVREKTKRSKRERQESTEVKLNEYALDIIKRWGNENKPNNYIFPIYENGLSKEDQHKRRINEITKTNKSIKAIAQILEFDVLPSIQYARHSYASQMLKMGNSIELISKALSHSSTKTTELYLSKLKDDTLQEAHNKLIDTDFDNKLKVEYKAG